MCISYLKAFRQHRMGFRYKLDILILDSVSSAGRKFHLFTFTRKRKAMAYRFILVIFHPVINFEFSYRACVLKRHQMSIGQESCFIFPLSSCILRANELPHLTVSSMVLILTIVRLTVWNCHHRLFVFVCSVSVLELFFSLLMQDLKHLSMNVKFHLDVNQS